VAVKIRTLRQQEFHKLEIIIIIIIIIIIVMFVKVSTFFIGTDEQTALSTREILKRGKVVTATADHC